LWQLVSIQKGKVDCACEFSQSPPHTPHIHDLCSFMMYSFVFALALLVSVGYAAEVVYFGDGWALLEGGDRNVNEFEEMFQLRNCNVNTTNGGSNIRATAANLATNPNSLLDNIQADTKYVWVSIGMNDIFSYFYGSAQEVDASIDKLVADTVVFYDPVFRARPDIRIVQYGYDLVDMCDSTQPGGGGDCENSQAQSTFPFCIETSCHNTQWMKLQNYVERLQQIYPQPFLTVLDMFGLMQRESFQVPGPYPNLNYCTPKTWMWDCAHPSSVGYTAMFDELWNQFFAIQYPNCVGNSTTVIA